MQDTRDQMNIIDVYVKLCAINKESSDKKYEQIAKQQFLEASEMLKAVYRFNKLLGDSWN